VAVFWLKSGVFGIWAQGVTIWVHKGREKRKIQGSPLAFYCQYKGFFSKLF
jgi:hypothetical protein